MLAMAFAMTMAIMTVADGHWVALAAVPLAPPADFGLAADGGGGAAHLCALVWLWGGVRNPRLLRCAQRAVRMVDAERAAAVASH